MMMAIQRIEPASGQESAWDYPRPPRVERTSRRIRVEFAGEVVADSARSLRVLETSHPPVYYLPPEDVRVELLSKGDGATFCEFKGRAGYFDVRVGDQVAREAAWTYLEPLPGYEELAGYLAFYPARVDACHVDGERARPQPGGFYGGWITDDVVGPFKGGPGTGGW